MIISKYLFREILYTFLTVVCVLLLIYVSDRFVRYLGDAAAGTISAQAILELMMLKMFSSVALFIPLGLFVSVLLGFGRLYRDSEIVALTAGGVGIDRLTRHVLWVSLVFAAVSLVLSLYVSPQVSAMVEKRLEEARDESDISGIFPGRFKEFGGGDHVVYVESVDTKKQLMHNVFVQVRRADTVDLVVAKSGYHSIDSRNGDRFIILEDGYRYEGAPGDVDFTVTQFEQHAVRVDLGQEPPPQGYQKMESIPTAMLFAKPTPRNIAELQWRFSLPVTVVVLSILAVPLARTSPREGRYGKLFTAVLIYFVYNNLLGVSQQLVERGDLTPVIGVWPVHVAFALAGLAMLSAQTSQRWRKVRAAVRRLRRRG